MQLAELARIITRAYQSCNITGSCINYSTLALLLWRAPLPSKGVFRERKLLWYPCRRRVLVGDLVSGDRDRMWKLFSRKKRRAPADETVADLREKFHLETVSDRAWQLSAAHKYTSAALHCNDYIYICDSCLKLIVNLWWHVPEWLFSVPPSLYANPNIYLQQGVFPEIIYSQSIKASSVVHIQLVHFVHSWINIAFRVNVYICTHGIMSIRQRVVYIIQYQVTCM